MKYLGILIIGLMLVSCRDKAPETLIQGHLDNPEGKILTLHALGIKELTPIDSTRVSAGGEFSLTPLITEAGFYILQSGPDQHITLVIAPADRIKITGAFGRYDTEGSASSALYERYFEKSKQHESYIDSLTAVVRKKNYFDEQGKLLPVYRHKFDSVFEAQEKFARNLIENNPGSLASLLILNQRFGRAPLFDPEDDLVLYKKLDSALMEKLPGNQHVQDHHQRLKLKLQEMKEKEKARERLKIGKEIPDVSLKDTSGKQISLHSLKGKKVIVYFWSAIDARSRQSNHELKKLYKRLNQEEYAIYAVSLDANKAIWKNALKLDDLNWINVNDPEGPHSALIKLFNLPQSLPYYFLIDRESKIKYKGKNLEELKLAIEQP